MIYSRVKSLLSAFGLEIDENEGDFVEICIESAKNYILSFCAVKELPPELVDCCAEMACAAVLRKKLCRDVEKLDFDKVVKSISEGDVSVSYESEKSSKEVFEDILTRFENKDAQLLKYRKLSW